MNSYKTRLVKQLKLEVQLRRDLKRFFTKINNDTKRYIRITGIIPSLSYYKEDLEALLESSYARATQQFKHTVVTPIEQKAFIPLEDTQTLAGTIILNKVKGRGLEHASIILDTTEKDYTQILKKSIASSLAKGIKLTTDKLANKVIAAFKDKIKNKTDLIATVETTSIVELTRQTEAQTNTKGGTKQWVTTLDERTRHSHASADGQEVPIDEPFTVQGQSLMFPGDSLMGASLNNLINCRCSVEYALND